MNNLHIIAYLALECPDGHPDMLVPPHEWNPDDVNYMVRISDADPSSEEVLLLDEDEWDALLDKRRPLQERLDVLLIHGLGDRAIDALAFAKENNNSMFFCGDFVALDGINMVYGGEDDDPKQNEAP